MKKHIIHTATPWFALIQVFLWGTYGILFSYANPYLTEKIGLSDSLAGIVLCIATAISFLLQPLVTALADRRGLRVKKILLFSGLFTAVCAAATMLPGLSASATMLLFAASCVGLQVQPSFSNALGMEGIRGGQQIDFALARGIGSVSFGLSARIGALLIQALGMDGTAIAGAVTALLMTLATMLMPEAKQLAPRSEDKPTTASVFFGENPKLATLLLGAVLLYVGHNVLSNCMFRIAQSKLPGVDTAGVTGIQGTALLIAAAVELPTMFLFTKIVRRIRCDLLLLTSCIFMTLRLLLTLLLPGEYGLYIAQLSQMLGFALFAVSTVYYVGTVVEKRNVVKGQTYLGAANTLGCVLAYAGGGLLIDAVGVGKMQLVCLLISLVGTLLVLLSLQRVQKTVGAD